MFRRLDDFKKVWASEAESTVKLLRALTDRSLTQRVTPDGRSLGTLAWHIVTSITEMMNRTGLQVPGPVHEPAPPSAAEILRTYERVAAALLEEVDARWTDASLEETRDMYGEHWTNGFTLNALIAHQTHHRGQMTVLMRQAGLTVAGVYGPAREEWAAMGMPAME